jgi:Mlc titration factor MtfA (ptsG expression regulator)
MITPFLKFIILLIVLAVISAITYFIYNKKNQNNKSILTLPFPEGWRNILNEHVKFYRDIAEDQKAGFEKRIQLFLATKKIEPIDTEIDDSIKIMVAASAIIPMFAFPGYNYPDLREILIYPNSFDENFQTQRFAGNNENIIGMVGNRFMNGTIIISKPDLLRAYDGINHKSNVGIHEFVHLIDNIDGATDGIPENLLQHAHIAPWLHLIKEEMARIEKGRSDISPYALTSNAEFLAVVSEYFFDNPEKFKRKHPELYQYLTSIFHQTPENGTPPEA